MMNMLHNVPCTTCGVAVGKPCLRTGKHRSDGVHVARKDAWLTLYDGTVAERIAVWLEETTMRQDLVAAIRAGAWRKGQG